MGEGGERRIGKVIFTCNMYTVVYKGTHTSLDPLLGLVQLTWYVWLWSPTPCSGAAWECLSHECVRAVHLLTSPAPVGRYCASCVLYVCAHCWLLLCAAVCGTGDLLTCECAHLATRVCYVAVLFPHGARRQGTRI